MQGKATCPGGAAGPEVAAALSVLASLAREEHAAASSTVEVRQIDAVFRAFEINEAFKAIQTVPAPGLPVALASLQGKLDNLKDFWNGK